MYLGRIVEYGTVDEVLNNPAHPYTKALIKAVPTQDMHLEKTDVQYVGTMPSPSNPPSGCHFHTRCEHVMPECRHIKPENIKLSSSHKVACLLFMPTDS